MISRNISELCMHRCVSAWFVWGEEFWRYPVKSYPWGHATPVVYPAPPPLPATSKIKKLFIRTPLRNPEAIDLNN